MSKQEKAVLTLIGGLAIAAVGNKAARDAARSLGLPSIVVAIAGALVVKAIS